MRALLVRVGADCTEAGGRWNGPVDSVTGAFAYVPIPEPEPLRSGHATPFARWADAVERLGARLPERLRDRNAHSRDFCGKCFRIEIHPPQPISIDGEVLATTPVTARIAAGAIEVAVV